MKLKLVLHAQGRDRDVITTTDSATTVGDLAAYLLNADPERSSSRRSTEQMTLALVDQGMRALDPRSTIADSGLQSGVRVSLTRGSDAFTDRGSAAAVLVFTSGPQAGQEIELSKGTHYIGRGRGCEVRLQDEAVSRRHAKLIITDIVEIADLGSANGLTVSDQLVTRTQISSGDIVRIGETELKVRRYDSTGDERASDSGVLSGEAGTVMFSRSPRVAPEYKGEPFEVPELPQRQEEQPFPMIMMLIPIIMGGVLVAVTRSAFTIVFMLMMPAMVVGAWWEQRRHAKKQFEKRLEEFREDVGILAEEIKRTLQIEERVRQAEIPSGEECLIAIRDRSGLMWTRRQQNPHYLDVRLGLATLPSRNEIKMPKMGRSTAEAWLEIKRRMSGLEVVPNVPVIASFSSAGAVGIAGPRPVALAAARSVVLQIVGLHSPAEVIVAAFAAGASTQDWDFLKWLPHTSSTHSPVGSRVLVSSQPDCIALADELEAYIAGAPKSQPDQLMIGRPRVVVLVEPDAPIDRSRLVNIAENGGPAGVHVVWIAPRQQVLPAACQTFLAISQREGVTVGHVHEGEQVTPVEPDLMSEEMAIAAARVLAPVVDSGVPIDDASDLPRSVSMLALTGTELARDEKSVIERWSESRSILTGPFAPSTPYKKPGNLRAIIGQSSQGTYSIDLRSDGPHALVGGTTGAGKSELLQAWILGMASAHSPQRVTFLLVDYKGGSAFRDCVKLPHTVGLVTDLSPHLVRRALASLSAELRYREHLLARFKAKDLVELERRGEVEAPPSLVIIVDEFAALVQEVPEFVDGVVNVAQRGRSLGLHLILATQRPAGVIKDNLRANTNLRMALRMADEADSEDVLGSNDAAFFDPALPGRAMSKTGPGRLVPFQTGYAGGWTSDVPPPPDMQVEALTFGAGRMWEIPEDPEASRKEAQKDLGPTDIQRLVGSISRACKTAEIPKPRKPWLPDMRAVYDLAALPTSRRDDELTFGVADDPDNQSQPEMTFYPDKEGNMVVYGASGSGKSVFLRTMALAAGYTVRGGPCQVYGLDFGNRGLSMLEVLPHVGSIIPGSDHERLTRLLRTLRETIDERAVRYSRVSAATITDYRRIANKPDEPRIFVLIDNMTAFRQAYEQGKRYVWLDHLAGLAGDGRPVGVHFLITVDQRTGMPNNIAAAIPRRIVLRMSGADEYGNLDVPQDVLSLESPPGRGLLDDTEVQIAVLGGSTDVTVQAAAVEKFAEATKAAGVPSAPPIESLTEHVELADLPAEHNGRPTIAIGSTLLGPVGYDPRGTFVIVGPSGSGRTTALKAMATSLNRFASGVELILMTPRRSSELRDLPFWSQEAIGPDAIEELAERIAEDLDEGNIERPLAIFIERLDDLEGTVAERALEVAIKAAADNEQFIVSEGESTFFNSNFGMSAVAKTSRVGIVLHPDGQEGFGVFRAEVPELNRAELPPGRGFLVQKGHMELVQVGNV